MSPPPGPGAQPPPGAAVPIELVLCPECGAALPPADPQCWLCGRPMERGATRRPPAGPRPMTPTSVAATTVLALTTVALVGFLLLIGVASFQEAPGVTLAMVGVLTVPLLVVLTGLARGHERGQAPSLLDLLARYLLSLMVVVGVLVMLAVAAVAAFVAFCFYAMSTGKF